MGFIENLRKSINGELTAIQQRKIQDAALQQAQERQRRQQEAQEAQIRLQRRIQAEAFQKESGIKTLTSTLAKLIEQDPRKQSPKGKMRLPEHGGFDPGRGYTLIELVARSARSTHRLIDIDSRLEGVIWYDGESSREGETGDDAVVSKYIKYFVVEVNPDGDVVFNSAERNPVPVNLWRRDKDCLERALENAYNRPAIYTYSYPAV